jgi:hypothetical protein
MLCDVAGVFLDVVLDRHDEPLCSCNLRYDESVQPTARRESSFLLRVKHDYYT